MRQGQSEWLLWSFTDIPSVCPQFTVYFFLTTIFLLLLIPARKLI
jgi:hypothetical protein